MDTPRRSRAHALSSLGLDAEREETFELAPHEQDALEHDAIEQEAPHPAPVHAASASATNVAGFDSLTRGEHTWMWASVVIVVALCAVGVYLSR